MGFWRTSAAARRSAPPTFSAAVEQVHPIAGLDKSPSSSEPTGQKPKRPRVKRTFAEHARERAPNAPPSPVGSTGKPVCGTRWATRSDAVLRRERPGRWAFAELPSRWVHAPRLVGPTPGSSGRSAPGSVPRVRSLSPVQSGSRLHSGFGGIPGFGANPGFGGDSRLTGSPSSRSYLEGSRTPLFRKAGFPCLSQGCRTPRCGERTPGVHWSVGDATPRRGNSRRSPQRLRAPRLAEPTAAVTGTPGLPPAAHPFRTAGVHGRPLPRFTGAAAPSSTGARTRAVVLEAGASLSAEPAVFYGPRLLRGG
jgi:hypothetical protein